MVIRTERFTVTFSKRDGDGTSVDSCVATLHEADASTYGNGTLVSIKFDKGMTYFYDTRYVTELNDPDNFGKWAKRFVAKEIFTNVISVD